MRSYAMLVHPSANRVYAEASVALTVAELSVLAQTRIEGAMTPAEPTHIAGVRYLAFDADLTTADVRLLGDVSTAMALFERTGDSMVPVELPRRDRFDDDLLTILKYPGKTNEVFTHLLLNVTVWSGVSVDGRPPRVLDPMCGRGTTLNRVLMNGWHARGIDQDRKDFEAYAAFLRQWLRDKRLKHSADVTPLRREGVKLGRRFRAEIGATKEEWKAGEVVSVDFVNTDTLNTRLVHRAASVDAVVTDAPYGVQHGSRNDGRLARSPLDLLRAAVPLWAEVLRPGGCLGLAWNTRVAGRQAALDVLAASGLVPLDDGVYQGFEHRVDQSIQRDILVARKPD